VISGGTTSYGSVKASRHSNGSASSSIYTTATSSIYQYKYPALFYRSHLFQQYIIDAFVACETTMLNWLCEHQDNIYTDIYSRLTDILIYEDISTGDIGRQVILPASFTGSDRYIQ
jgi:UDP-galactopyranose mutase